MKFLETNIWYEDLLFGVFFFIVGGYILIRRKKIIDAMLASNKIFWEKMDFKCNGKSSIYMTKITISIIGIVFFCTGILLIYRGITSFFY